MEAFRGGSHTRVEGEFEIKNGVGLYLGPSAYEGEGQCAIVLRRKSQKQIDVTSFGRCEEGHRAYPDGNYQKQSRNAR